MQPLWKSFAYFPHQEEGIEWMLEKECKGTLVPNKDYSAYKTVYGGLQCDDMGLGKTIQITSVIANNPKSATLIVAPLAMIETWTSVCSRAGMRVFEIQKQAWTCINAGINFPARFRKMRPSVYVTNYEKIIHNPSFFEIAFDRIVLDEAHKIRNGDGEFAKSIRRISAPIRWAVTGTPLVNSLKDIVSLLAFIGVPHSLFYSWEPRYYEILPDLLIHRSLESLRGIIEGVPPAPEIINDIIPFVSEEEEEFYKGVQFIDEELASKYTRDILTSTESFKLLLRLRQLSVHPQVYINAKRREDPTYDREDWTEPSTKFERIKEIIIDDDDKRVHKYIIFCQFMEEMELLADELKTIVPEILMYNGSMTQKQRTDVLAYSKQTEKTTVMLIQLQAGGVGLNLQEYDRIIFISPWWTSALMDQAIARAVRMGQKEVVKVYHLKLWEEWDNVQIINIDSKIQEKADEKRQMLEKIFNICAEEQFIKKWREMDELEAVLEAKLATKTLKDEVLETPEALESASTASALEPGETRP